MPRPKSVGPTEAQSSVTKIFERQQLDTNNREIRILHLLPAISAKFPIHCTLHTASLDSNPRYEALSYAWGDSLVCERVFVNGRPRNVTINLVAALKRLRRRVHARYLWVDALCINQADDEEKSHQVNLMKEIYSRTTNAILWLGDYSDSWVRQCPGEERGPYDAYEPDQVPPINPNAILSENEALVAFEFLESLASGWYFPPGVERTKEAEPFLALDKLMHLAWWSRVWTVQESVLPRKATVVYGAKSLLLKDVFAALNHLWEHHANGHCGILWTHWEAFSDKVGTIQCYQSMRSFGSQSFTQALNDFRIRIASDPKDHVYALLGLGGDIIADYSLSPSEVFTSSVRRSIVRSKSLDPLLRPTEFHRSPNLPTWVPDWGAEIDEQCSIYEERWRRYYDLYKAALETLPKIRDTTSASMLDLQGSIVDIIVSVGDYARLEDVYGPRDSVPDRWQAMASSYSQGKAGAYVHGGSWEIAFWRVGCMDVLDIEPHKVDNTKYRRALAKDEQTCRDQARSLGLNINKRFFITNQGMFGLGPRDLRADDVICVFWGGRMPLALRRAKLAQDGRICFEYVGEVYVHGIMDGEILAGGAKPTWISLI